MGVGQGHTVRVAGIRWRGGTRSRERRPTCGRDRGAERPREAAGTRPCTRKQDKRCTHPRGQLTNKETKGGGARSPSRALLAVPTRSGPKGHPPYAGRAPPRRAANKQGNRRRGGEEPQPCTPCRAHAQRTNGPPAPRGPRAAAYPELEVTAPSGPAVVRQPCPPAEPPWRRPLPHRAPSTRPPTTANCGPLCHREQPARARSG